MSQGRPSNDDYYLSLLAGIAARGTCVRRQVGAIITDENHRVLSMGFNGTPKGFPHCGDVAAPPCPTNHQYWDMGRCVGCMKSQNEISNATRFRERILCLGQDDPKGDTRRCMAVHAEINAILTCTDIRHAHNMYVSATPCKACALTIANTNIKRIICLERYADDASYILAGAGILLGIHVPAGS
jgi:dCMP deaminase